MNLKEQNRPSKGEQGPPHVILSAAKDLSDGSGAMLTEILRCAQDDMMVPDFDGESS